VKLYRDLLPEEEAGVVSRIYLMHGCRFDDDSILQRLDMDCGLSWTHLDLAIAKVQLSISNDVWARAYNLLMTKHGAGLSSIHAFDIARKTHPGEAGFVLGKALTAKASELEKIFPEGSTQILAGYRLAHALAGANTLSTATRRINRHRRLLTACAIPASRILDLADIDAVPKDSLSMKLLNTRLRNLEAPRFRLTKARSN